MPGSLQQGLALCAGVHPVLCRWGRGKSSSVTCDGPSGSPPLVGFCLGQHELHLRPLVLARSRGWAFSDLHPYTKKEPFQSHFVSVLLLAFRASFLKCLHTPFSSSLLYPGEPQVTAGDRMLGAWVGSAVVLRPVFLNSSLSVTNHALGLG